MKSKISKKKLNKMINSGFTDLSVDRIKVLIEVELSKDESLVDTEYIDSCFKLLSIKESDNVKYRKSIKPTKSLWIAAAVLVVLISAVTVSAQVFNFNIPQKIAQLINGNAQIDINLKDADTTADDYALINSDLAKEIAKYGITPVTLPEYLVNGNCKIKAVENISTDKTISSDLSIDFEYEDRYGYLVVSKFAEEYDWVGDETVKDVISGQMININGMDVLLFEQKNSCTIEYKDNLTVYNIYLECDLETAIKFTKSIK